MAFRPGRFGRSDTRPPAPIPASDSEHEKPLLVQLLVRHVLEVGQSVWLHVEVKAPGVSLLDGQAPSYPRRAACWSDASRRPHTVPAHEDWRTILVHDGDGTLTPEEEQSFQRVVTHEEVASWLTGYPQT